MSKADNPQDAPAVAGRPAPGAGTAKAAKGTRRAARQRRWPLVFAGSATAVLVGAAVVAGTVFPGQSATARIAPEPQSLPVGNTLANCAGPTRLLSGSSDGTDPQFSGNSSTTSAQVNAAIVSNPTGLLPGAQLLSLDASAKVLSTIAAEPNAPAPDAPAAKPSAALLSGKAVSEASVLRGTPFNGEAAQSSGSVLVTATDGDLRGLAAANCQPAGNDLWLAGASTSVGRTSVLTLTNSSASPATVSLDLYGASGPIQTPGGRGLVVAPHSARSLVLAGLAPGQDRLTVHMKSTGGAVSALIQQSVLRGLTPGGVDFIAPTQAPALSQTIPGVKIRPDAGAISAQSGYADASTVLHVSVPGSVDSVVSVKVFGNSGQIALPNGGVFTAPAGKVTELPLGELPAGTYSLSVTADHAFTATARLVGFTKPGEAVDIAYAPAATRLGTNHVLTLPGGVHAELALTAPAGSATVSLTPVSPEGVLGKTQKVELKSGTTQVVDPVALLGDHVGAVIISADGAAVYGTGLLGVKEGAGISVLPILAGGAGSPAINLSTGY